MQLNSYLIFNGQCEAAFHFYQQSLGGKIEAMMPHAGTPAESHVPAEWPVKIMHARLTVGASTLMGSDAPPERYEPAKGFSVNIGVTIRRRPSASFRLWPKTGLSTCRSRRLFGPPDSVCWWIGLEYPGC